MGDTNKTRNSTKILDNRGEEVNFHISNTVRLITLANGVHKVDQGFRVALAPDALEGGTISAKLKNGADVFQTIPVYLGGFNDYIITEINTSGHTNITQLYIGY
ncbi:MAG: hypothetical protein WC942_12415 [Clostridia bacterium]|jgi:hypothetical protein